MPAVSFPRKRARLFKHSWIPACAGMTVDSEVPLHFMAVSRPLPLTAQCSWPFRVYLCVHRVLRGSRLNK